MSPKVHLIQGVAGAAVLYPFVGERALIFGMAIVCIDVDHIIEYYLETRTVSIRGLFTYHKVLLNNLNNYLGLNLFHTLECYAILLFAGFYFSEAYFILMGFLFHHVFDQIQLMSINKPFSRAFSIIEYAIRRKKYYTSLGEVLKKGERPYTAMELRILLRNLTEGSCGNADKGL